MRIGGIAPLLFATFFVPHLIAQSGIQFAGRTAVKVSFGEHPRKGFIPASPNTLYDSVRGYGFMQSSPSLQQDRDSTCSDTPFLFSVAVPEGSYDLTLRVGSQRVQSSVAVKAEARRLLVEPLQNRRGKFVTRRFTINVRYKELSNGKIVHLKNDEQNDLDWDHRLTLEFNGSHPCVSELELHKNDHAITVYLAGDSTVTDQRREPWAAWGRCCPDFSVWELQSQITRNRVSR